MPDVCADRVKSYYKYLSFYLPVCHTRDKISQMFTFHIFNTLLFAIKVTFDKKFAFFAAGYDLFIYLSVSYLWRHNRVLSTCLM